MNKGVRKQYIHFCVSVFILVVGALAFILLTDKVERVSKFCDTYWPICSILASAICWLVGFFSGQLHENRLKLQLSKAMSFVWNRPVEVFLPACCDVKVVGIHPALKGSKYIMTVEGSRSVEEITRIVEDVISSDAVIDYKIPTDNPMTIYSGSNNLFLVGDIFSNDMIREIFLQQFSKLKFVVSQGQYDEKFSDLLKLTNGNASKVGGFMIDGVQMHSLDYNTEHEGYVMWIKMTGKADFNSESRGTIHLCLGSSPMATWKAVRCYNTRRAEMIRFTRMHTNHYFLVAKVGRDNVPQFGGNDRVGIVDLTKEMFGTN